MAQTVKNLPAMREIQVRSLGQEDLLDNCLGLPGCSSGLGRTHTCVVSVRLGRMGTLLMLAKLSHIL